MAYDAAKAHEYYIKYRKKGLKKGRKKGKAKKAAQTNLVGLSSAGLNDAGKMQAALIRENIKKEMNAALAKETDPVKREAIRQQYQNKALSEIAKLKNNSQYTQAKKTSAKSGGKSSGGSKASGSKSSGSSSGSSKSGGSSTKTDNSAQRKAAIEAATTLAQDQINQLFDKIKNMTPEEKKTAKDKVQNVLTEIEQIQATLKKTTDKIRDIYG